MKTLLVIVAITLSSAHAQTKEFWLREGQKAVQDALNLQPNVGVARNIIVLLGDGMGVSTITAARILKGQMEGGNGPNYRLNMEQFPHVGLLKTYSIDLPVPDSAATSTAYMCGVKTNDQFLGIDSRGVLGDCSKMPDAKVECMVEWAVAEGKSVGLISTAKITDASPGGSYAKTPHRGWQSDANMKGVTGCDNVKDIARQLIEDNHDIRVILGGGRVKFLPTGKGGEREDGRDLVETWKKTQEGKGKKCHYVENNDEFKAIPQDTDYLLGLFADGNLEYDADRTERGEGSQPSISEMVEQAIKILSKNENGYFLFVEGGRIDHAHHKVMAHKALIDTIALDKAVKSATTMTSEADTLILVTADHSHVFTIGGYPFTGESIVGKMAHSPSTDGTPMTILAYGNGPGPANPDLTNVDTTVKDFKFPVAMSRHSETHSGEDVAVMARGPMSHLFRGIKEQTLMAHLMSYIACIGRDKSHCTKMAQMTDAAPSNRRTEWMSLTLAAGISVFIMSSVRW